MSELATVTTATTMNEIFTEEDAYLSKSELLSHEEVIKQRARRLKQLARVYKDHYWCMMEDLKLKYRKYYWEYGTSPYQDGGSDQSVIVKDKIVKNENESELGLDIGNDLISSSSSSCAVHGCKSKAMALTKFCHGHILSDSKQKLYMGCNYVIKRYVFILFLFLFSIFFFVNVYICYN